MILKIEFDHVTEGSPVKTRRGLRTRIKVLGIPVVTFVRWKTR